MALMLSSSFKHGGMTGLPLGVPAGVYSELFLAVAVLAAILEGLEELGVSTLRSMLD